jgi:tRNA A-37 threonylcarbamoyl transferase component Bud32
MANQAKFMLLGQGRTLVLIDPERIYRPGDVVDGRYQLAARLGKGAAGIVFACKHVVLDKTYAIKILSPEHVGDSCAERFVAEAQALAKLRHPGIVGIHNSGLDQGIRPYYVMDLLSGDPLDSIIAASDSLPVDWVLDVFIQVANALSYAHAQGIIHRDIKPSNLMIMRETRHKSVRVKIVDFGIARLAKQSAGMQSQTATGQVFGTPLYMSPEQCRGGRVDDRSDIYSLGCALYQALTGSPPFKGENAFQTFMMHQEEPLPSLASRAPDVDFPPWLEMAVEKMLAKDVADRYQTAAQVGHDLERIRAGKEILVKVALKPGGGQESAGPAWSKDIAGPGEFARAVCEPKNVNFAQVLLPLALAVVPFLFLGSLALVCHPIKARPAVHGPGENMPNEKVIGDYNTLGSLKAIGCTASDIAVLDAYCCRDNLMDQDHVRRFFEAFLAGALNRGFHFIGKDRSVIKFPPQVIIGAVRFGDNKPVYATGKIKIPANQSICFFQNHCIGGDLHFLDLFGPDDLTGLEVAVWQPRGVIKKIRNWKKLKELSFFNSLSRVLPGFENYDESPIKDQDLPALDQFKGLENLGLCGRDISGGAVSRMGLLNTLSGLRLKRIADIDALLRVLPKKDNLKEVWLIGQDTTDGQLESLARMKNLETVKIIRSKLTPKSVVWFRKMTSLKYLELDRNWTSAEKEQFQSALPQSVFVPVVDPTWWKVIEP